MPMGQAGPATPDPGRPHQNSVGCDPEGHQLEQGVRTAGQLQHLRASGVFSHPCWSLLSPHSSMPRGRRPEFQAWLPLIMPATPCLKPRWLPIAANLKPSLLDLPYQALRSLRHPTSSCFNNTKLLVARLHNCAVSHPRTRLCLPCSLQLPHWLIPPSTRGSPGVSPPPRKPSFGNSTHSLILWPPVCNIFEVPTGHPDM